MYPFNPAKARLSFQITFTLRFDRCPPSNRLLRLGDLLADSAQGAPGPSGPYW
jgi:hypothetical protein